MTIKQKYILAVDPGFRHTGYVVYSPSTNQIIAAGCINTTALSGTSVAASNRHAVEFTTKALSQLADRYPIKTVLAELQAGSSKSQKAARGMALSFATIVAFCSLKTLDLKSVTPVQVKRVVGKGSISKAQVIEYFIRRFGSTYLPKQKRYQEHIADAGMVLLHHLNSK